MTWLIDGEINEISVPAITFPSVSFTLLDIDETLRESAEGDSIKLDVDMLLVKVG